MITLNVFGIAYQDVTLTKSESVTLAPVTTNPLFSQDLTYRTSGITRSEILSTNADINLDVNVTVQQAPFYNHIRAFAINGSRMSLGSGENNLNFNTVVYSDNLNTFAVGVDRTGINPRQNYDNVTISAHIVGNTNMDSQAIGVRDSFIGLGQGSDNILVEASGPNALWGQRAVISAGQDNASDNITGIGNAENVVVRGWDGDDVISVGKVTYTGPWTIRKEWMANGTVDRTYNQSLIHGGFGYDVLSLQHMDRAQFMAQYIPLNQENKTFTFKDTPGVVYEGFEQVVTNDPSIILL